MFDARHGARSQPSAGWEPDPPSEDSLLRRFLVNWAASIEAHGLPVSGRGLRRDDFAAVDLGRPSFGGNVATLTAPLFTEDVAEVTAALDASTTSTGSNADSTPARCFCSLPGPPPICGPTVGPCLALSP
jgi:hypothetical protein